jgi:putative ABC transport system permease protein
METFAQDLRYGCRMLRKTPGFTLIAVLALTLGIGANAAMFTVVNSVLLRPLSYKDSSRLVYLMEAFKRDPGMSFSYPEFQDYQRLNHVFESMGAIQANAYNLTGTGTPQQLDGRAVSQQFLPTLGVKPVFGRSFLSADDQPAAAPTAILGYGFWQRNFGGNPQTVGSVLTLDGRDYSVIGILPKDFSYRDEQPDVFIPLGIDANQEWASSRSEHNGIYCVGKLKPGVSIDQAQADLDTIAASLSQQFPITNKNVSVNARMLRDRIVGRYRPTLLMLLGAVGFVLLIACANIANLLLARATARQRELAIRAALGADRARLIRQLLTESLVLAFAGGVLGIALAVGAVNLLVALAPDALPRAQEIHVDFAVVLFTAAISLITGLIFGTMPALQGSSLHPNEALKEGLTASAGARRQSLRNALVISELALSLVLLIGAGLLIRSFAHVLQIDPGFNPRQVLTARIVLPEKKYSKPEQVEAFFDEVLRNLQQQPGVKAAGAVTPLPLTGNEWDTDYRIEGKPQPSVGEFPNTRIYHASADYLATMQIPVVEGRSFLRSDVDGNLPVVVVSREFVKQNFAGENPIGHRLRLGGPRELVGDDPKYPWMTIVGVAGDVKHDSLDSENPKEVYTAFAQHYGRHTQRFRTLVIRGATSDALALTPGLRKVVLGADKDQPIATVQTMDQLVSDSLGSRKLSMSLLMSFAALALVLAVIGIYGVMSYSVSQRTQEIGIRMALGADQQQVLFMIVRQAFRLVAIGLATGIGLALLLALTLSRVLSDQLFGIKATDPLTFISIAAILSVVALLASGIPAHKATRVNPVVALRHE